MAEALSDLWGIETHVVEIADQILPGIIVDPNSQLMGLDRVDFALVGEYPRHPITQNLSSLSLFPQAQALEFSGDERWQLQVFLQSDERSWNETGELRGEIFKGDNDDESSGPLNIGPHDSVEVALAIVGGQTVASLLANAAKASASASSLPWPESLGDFDDFVHENG